MAKLILHAGLHKTGTTAIQAFAHQNRMALRDQGVLYPDYRPLWHKQYEAHHDFAHAIAGQGKRLSAAQTEKLAKRWAAAAAAENLTVFLSSEAISRHVDETVSGNWTDKRTAYLKKLAHILSDFDVMIIIVLRRQDAYVKSLFQEHVMKNSAAGRQPFAAFRKKFSKSKIQRRFYQNLLLFEDIFPRIQIMIYEDLIKDGQLCVAFFSRLGLDVRHMKQVGVVRKSLSARETLLKVFLNQGITNNQQNKRALEWIKSPEVQNLLDKHYGRKRFDLWESQKTKQEFLAHYEAENEWIRQRYLPEIPFPLFPPLQTDEIPVVPSLPEALKAELALKSVNSAPSPTKGCIGKWVSWIRYWNLTPKGPFKP